MTSSHNVTPQKSKQIRSATCHQSFVLFYEWSVIKRLTESIIIIPQCPLHVLFPIFQLHVLCILHRLLIIFGLEKRLDVNHGLPDVLTKPVRVLQVAQKGNETQHTDTDESMKSLILRSYCVRAGVFAGDVECDEVFPNNYIRHTITIVSHLGVDKRCCYTTVPKHLLHQKDRAKLYDRVTSLK